MPEPVKKVSSLIVRDSSGHLVNMLPKTEAGAVSYKQTNAAAELERLDGQDVASVGTALQDHSETATETRHVAEETPQTINNLWDIEIKMGYKVPSQTSGGEDEYGTISSYGNDNVAGGVTVVGSNFVYGSTVRLESNTPYYIQCTTAFPENSEWNGLQFFINYYINDDVIDFLSPNGNYTIDSRPIPVSSSEYSEWEGREAAGLSVEEPVIQFEPPAEIGDRKSLFLNARCPYSSSSSIPSQPVNSEDRVNGIEVDVIKTANNAYRFEFVFANRREYDETVETVTRWKTLETTTVKKNGEESTVSNPVTGLLQNISISESKVVWVNELVESSKTYPMMATIADESMTMSDYFNLHGEG